MEKVLIPSPVSTLQPRMPCMDCAIYQKRRLPSARDDGGEGERTASRVMSSLLASKLESASSSRPSLKEPYSGKRGCSVARVSLPEGMAPSHGQSYHCNSAFVSPDAFQWAHAGGRD